jgi:hypothetical protein
MKENPKIVFRNIISTDGTAINFMYSRLKKKSQPDEKKLQMTDFFEWELEKVLGCGALIPVLLMRTSPLMMKDPKVMKLDPFLLLNTM